MKTSTAERLIWSLAAITLIMVFGGIAWAGGNSPRAESSAEASVSSTVNAGSTISTGGNTLTGATNTLTGGTVTGGDVTVGGDSNRAYALANSLGDVDIAGCLGSEQWNTPLFGKQKLVTNWACLTEFYLRAEMYANAAIAICNTDIRREFETEQECRDAHPFEAMAVVPEPDSEDEDEEHAQILSRLDAQDRVIADLRAEKEKAMVRLQKTEKVAQRAYSTPQTVIQRESFIDDDKRAALEALKGEK